MIDTIVRRLISVASKSDMKYKHACAIIKRGRIISTGYNHYLGSSSIHAEFNATRGHRLPIGCKAIIIRVNKTGRLVNSHPCIMCVDRFRSIGIRRIWYSTDGCMVRACINRLNHVHISSGALYMSRA